MMTAMIMTGRTGAAYATQLGTMETGEEVDAFKTLGFSPMEFLVLPRTVALTLMMPLLAVYADLMGILGGGIVGVGLFGIPLGQYYTQTVAVVSLTDFGIGVMKSVFSRCSSPWRAASTACTRTGAPRRWGMPPPGRW